MRNIVILTVLLTIMPSVIYAKSDTITATFKYTLGDNDTRNDAKRIAFMEAKRRLSEQAGVFIESETTVVNSQLSRDEIKSYTAALLKVVVEKEEFQIAGENQSVIVTVKADIDTEEMARTLSEIRKDLTLQKKIKEQQVAVKELEDKIRRVQTELSSTDTDKAIQLRKERNIAFQQMGEVERIMFTIKTASKTALEVIERGMTTEEVRKIAGNPRGIETYSGPKWNYGNIWVVFQNNIVQCLVDANDYQSHLSCDLYQRTKKRILK